MDNPVFESRNRHSAGLAPASAATNATTTRNAADRTAKRIPILAQSAVKWSVSAEQDDALMRPATHHAANRLIIRGGMRVGAIGLAVAFVAGLLVPSAFAQAIPMPRPAPKA